MRSTFVLLFFATACEAAIKPPDLLGDLQTQGSEAPVISVAGSGQPVGSSMRPGLSWYWRLNGVDLADPNLRAAQVVDIDLYETPEASIRALKGKTVICYFSAGSYEAADFDRPDAREFPDGAKGKRMEGYPNERWLDIRAKGPYYSRILGIMKRRIQYAKDKGCACVEPDNVDSYVWTDDDDKPVDVSGFGVSEADSLNFLKDMAAAAHTPDARGKTACIGLKNGSDIASQAAGFLDFALTEDCAKKGECGRYEAFASGASPRPVFQAEYGKYSPRWCEEAARRRFSLVYYDLALSGGRYELCR